jgi:hypothetical protein
MAFAGLGAALVGFLLAATSVGLTESNGARLGLVLVGLIVSLGGIAVINQAYQKHAIWKR